jgi:hypothetical protein
VELLTPCAQRGRQAGAMTVNKRTLSIHFIRVL